MSDPSPRSQRRAPADPLDEFLQDDTPPRDGPLDVKAILDWSGRIQAWVQDEAPAPASHYVSEWSGAIFRPHEQATEAMLRLGCRFPVAIQGIQEFLDWVEELFKRAKDAESGEDVLRAAGRLAEIITCAAESIQAELARNATSEHGLSMKAAAKWYAGLTGTKPDPSSLRRMLKQQELPCDHSSVRLLADRANQRRGGPRRPSDAAPEPAGGKKVCPECHRLVHVLIGGIPPVCPKCFAKRADLPFGESS